MKNKLVLIFDDDSEINDISKINIFDNIKDAESFFDTDMFTNFKIDIDYNDFRFTGTFGWSGTGKVYWAEYH